MNPERCPACGAMMIPGARGGFYYCTACGRNLRPIPKRRIPEREVLAECLAWISSRPWARAWRNHVGTFRALHGAEVFDVGLRGSADILGFLAVNREVDPLRGHSACGYCGSGGRFLAIECKADGGRLSDRQAAFLDTVRKFGGVAIVARSLEDLKAQLKEEGYGDE